MAWVVGLLALLVVIVAGAAGYTLYLLEIANQRLADIQLGILKLRQGE